ncbi:MAG: exodeoxyribonuclease V subunit gamma [Chlamydiales bacterium]|nr:exodeoxyribonuclease V subunit gamma [Chlamydiales bacterium]
MNNIPQVIFSNSIHSLIQQLKNNIYYAETKFHRKLVILPSDNIKEEIVRIWSEDEEMNIAMGPRFINLNLAIDHLLALAQDRKQEYFFPRKEGLSFLIQKILKELGIEEEVIAQYLKNKTHREIELAEVLSDIFMEYAIYGDEALLPEGHFQKKIEKRIYEIFDHPHRVIHALKDKFFSEVKLEIHFFGFVHLPQIYLDFLLQAANTWDIFFYVFSPTPLFWGDLLSERKNLFYQHQVKEEGIGYEERRILADYLKVENPIINECIQAAKPFYLYIQDQSLSTTEYYQEDFGASVLSTIKKDIIEMSITAELREDESVQLHMMPNKLREIEGIKSCIDHLVFSHQYKGRDIAVYAPDIKEYAPYILYVFGSEGVFGYSIGDLAKAEESSLVHSFLQMLSLPTSLFSKEDVFEIFRCKAALLKMGITEEEFAAIEQKANKANIRWGFDGEHKKSMGAGRDNRGTWDYVLKQWVLSLAILEDNYQLIDPYGIGLFCSFDMAAVIGRFFHTLELLYHDFKDLLLEKKTLSDWSDFFYQILHRYFDVASLEKLEVDFEEICDQLQKIKQWDSLVDGELYTYESFRERFVGLIKKLKGNKRSLDDRERISFETLKIGNIKETNVVFFIGFDEDSFPRREEKNSLNLLNHEARLIPSKLQMDRLLFLQLLMNTREYFIMSYSSATEDPNSALEPSSMVSLLCNYPIKKYNHSSFRFSKDYFHEEGFLKSYSDSAYRLAQKYYNKKTSQKYVSAISHDKAASASIETKTIHLLQLKRFAAHPLRYYMNQTLGIYLREEESLLDAGEFFLSYAFKHYLIKAGLKEGLSSVIEKFKLSGDFPSGIFEQVALHEIEREVNPALESIKEFKTEKTFSICLEENVKEPYWESEDRCLFPPIECMITDLQRVVITGKIEDVGYKSLYVYRNNTFEELIKSWPELLIYKLCIKEGSSIAFLKDLTTLSIEKMDAMHLLKEYIIYFLQFEAKPSLFLPSWGSYLLHKDKESIDQKIISSFDTNGMFIDQYLHWMFKRPEQLFSSGEYAQQVEHIRNDLKGLKSWYETV